MMVRLDSRTTILIPSSCWGTCGPTSTCLSDRLKAGSERIQEERYRPSQTTAQSAGVSTNWTSGWMKGEGQRCHRA